MKTLRLLISLLLLVTSACSNNDIKLREALQKVHPKNFIPLKVFSTNREIDSWFTKNPDLDNAEGTSADRAYDQLNLQNKKEIIVAVIDSGVDISHQDLEGKIWVNKNEIPNNGIDDDHNGFIDDVNGWNFIGGHDAAGNPTFIDNEQLEVTRELVRMREKKKELESHGQALSPEDQAYFEKVLKEVKAGQDGAKQAIALLDKKLADLKTNYLVIQKLIKVPFEQMTADIVAAVITKSEDEGKAKQNILDIFTASGAKEVSKFLGAKKIYSDDLDYYYNESFRPREKIVKDDPENFDDVVYGNNAVFGPGADHGTHVAGIIAADRNNQVGIKGIAQNVKIMVLRVVPNGDERDKDIALAVKYAADNGAKIINMSFGKNYSPQKSQVGDAFKYAEEKGLLFMHAAGNESTDRDLEDRFPTRKVYTDAGVLVDTIGTWVDVGASSQFNNKVLVAYFSNYGQKTVDLFSPGVNLNSTVPGNKYAVFSGTSMASPAAAGVAALVWSQMPELSALEIKARLMETARSRAGLSVRLPGTSKAVPFETLSITGGIVDAYNALSHAYHNPH